MKEDIRVLHPAVKLMFINENKFFGPGPVQLLRKIDKCGNVRDACEKCGFSYSKGWTILKRCSDELGYEIVERQAGGQSGGIARVTEKGRELMAIYDDLETELSEIAKKRFYELAKSHGFDV
jgi:molybdate transport repressor ModE-like protein